MRPFPTGITCAAVMAAVLAGCSTGTMRIEGLGGVTYIVEGTSMGLEDRNGAPRIYNNRASVRVRDGRLFRGEQDLGEVHPGDRVLLARTGRVYVNDAERRGN